RVEFPTFRRLCQAYVVLKVGTIIQSTAGMTPGGNVVPHGCSKETELYLRVLTHASVLPSPRLDLGSGRSDMPLLHESAGPRQAKVIAQSGSLIFLADQTS